MKTAFISAMVGYGWGGSEELWSRAALKLVELGEPVAVLVEQQAGGALPLHPKLEALRRAGVTIEPARPRRFHKSVRWDDALERVKPDLVVISLGALFDGVKPLEAARASGVPYAIVVQAVIDTWQAERWRDYRELVRDAACVYFVSEDNRRLATRLLAAQPRSSRVVCNPFQVPYDASVPWPAPQPAARLAVVARLAFTAKGQDVLLEVLAQPKWRARPVEVSLYGAGPSEPYLRELAAHWQLANVSFRGHVDDVAGIWREHEALVLPSRCEGTPLALIEAMLCGRPAIVTEVANAGLLEDGTSGFVAAAATPSSLDAALERAWARRADWPAMGRAAAARAHQVIPRDPPAEFAKELRELAARVAPARRA